jgi:amino acid adenylation domain-containing protein
MSACSRLGISLSAVVHAAWARVLGTYSGAREVLFGSTTAGRPPELPGVESMVGLFINAAPVRVRIDPARPVGEWLTDIQRDLFRIQAHQFIGAGAIQEVSEVGRDQPLFETLLSFQNYPLDVGHGKEWAGIRMTDYGWTGPTNYPVTVRAFSGEQILLVLSFYEHRLPAGVADALLAQFRSLVERLPTSAEERLWKVGTLAGPDAERIVRDWNATAQPTDLDRTLHGIAARQAQLQPGHVAVIAGDGCLTYGELEARANQLARHLIEVGVRPGNRVGLCAEKSCSIVVAMLAVMKAGAAYVPIDPTYPRERIAYMIEDAAVAAMLTWGKGAEAANMASMPRIALDGDWPTVAKQSAEAIDRCASPDLLAYVIYTSGSAGQPKGVMLNHRGRVNNVADHCRRFAIGPADRFLCVSSLSFDISVCNIFSSLMAGACLVLPSAGMEKDPDHWLDLTLRHGVTMWHSAPMLMEAVVDSAGRTAKPDSALRVVMLDGDWIPLTLPPLIRATFPKAEVVSAGGATELSINSVIYPVGDVDPEWRSIPYGRPQANQSAYILDPSLELAPPGVAGELCLGGEGVGAGYWNRGPLTAEKFIPHPWPSRPGERIYRTGDLARFGPDGVIELLGRMDFQVKIRGVRIELGEVEAVLSRHPLIRGCVVSAPTDQAGERRLVAYVVLEPQAQNAGAAELRAWLRDRVPDQLVPDAFVELGQLPLTANGKVDRRALPAPVFAAAASTTAAPETELERRLAERWAEVLDVPLESVGVLTSFFDLGGNSLRAIRACRLGDVAVPITDLYRYKTIRALARGLEAGSSAREALVRLSISDPAPAIICVPYGGGHSGVYQPLAEALEGKMSVHSVVLPGHEHDGAEDRLEPIASVADAVVAAAREMQGRPLIVYGHCGGVALATEIARRLESLSFDLRSLVVGASYPPADGSALDQDPFAGVDDAELARRFGALGGFEDLTEDEALSIGRLLRHDGGEARRYFRAALSDRPRRLRTPLVCLLGDGDPLTLDHPGEWDSWSLVAENTRLQVLPGGHYFVREHPALVADRLLELVDEPAILVSPPMEKAS